MLVLATCDERGHGVIGPVEARMLAKADLRPRRRQRAGDRARRRAGADAHDAVRQAARLCPVAAIVVDGDGVD
jgi:hypothetical protein